MNSGQENGVLIFLFSFVLSGVLCMNFTCHRPTTPCDSWYGICQPDGACACSNGAFGLRCEIPGSSTLKGGSCGVHDPCVMGTCYDDKIVAKCDCVDGYYGERCEHQMVYAECDPNKMVINVFPYGYQKPWDPPPPLVGDNFTCGLDTVATFLLNYPAFSTRGWDGFAGVFAHSGDTCAGDPFVISETASMITYSRTIYISYNASGPHPTDQTLELACDVIKGSGTTKTPNLLAPPSVEVLFQTPRGDPLPAGPVKLGSKIHVHFSLNIPNSGGYDDAQVESCTLRDPYYLQNIVVVDRACAQSPVGELLYKKGPGVAVLIMSVYKFPGMSAELSFQCHVRVCNRNLDNYCSTPAQCLLRGKRSVPASHGGKRAAPASHGPDPRHQNYILVESTITIRGSYLGAGNG